MNPAIHVSDDKRERIPPRARILAAAGELFYREGIRGVGVDAIAEAAGTNKMTLYRHFASKDELIAEWVRGIVRQKEADWDALSAEHEGDPQGQLQAWSRNLAAKLAEMEARGASLHNALAELPDPDHPARQLIQAHKVRELKRIQALCEDAGFPNPKLAADLF